MRQTVIVCVRCPLRNITAHTRDLSGVMPALVLGVEIEVSQMTRGLGRAERLHSMGNQVEKPRGWGLGPVRDLQVFGNTWKLQN